MSVVTDAAATHSVFPVVVEGVLEAVLPSTAAPRGEHPYVSCLDASLYAPHLAVNDCVDLAAPGREGGDVVGMGVVSSLG